MDTRSCSLYTEGDLTVEYRINFFTSTMYGSKECLNLQHTFNNTESEISIFESSQDGGAVIYKPDPGLCLQADFREASEEQGYPVYWTSHCGDAVKWELNCTGIRTQLHGCSGTKLQVRGHPKYCLTFLARNDTWTSKMLACRNKTITCCKGRNIMQSSVLTLIAGRGWDLKLIDMTMAKVSPPIPSVDHRNLNVNYTLTELELIPKKDLLSTSCSDLSVQHGQVLLNDMVPVFLPGEEITVQCNPGFGAKFDNGSYLEFYNTSCWMFLSLVDCSPLPTELGNFSERGTSSPGSDFPANGIGSMPFYFRMNLIVCLLAAVLDIFGDILSKPYRKFDLPADKDCWDYCRYDEECQLFSFSKQFNNSQFNNTRSCSLYKENDKSVEQRINVSTSILYSSKNCINLVLPLFLNKTESEISIFESSQDDGVVIYKPDPGICLQADFQETSPKQVYPVYWTSHCGDAVKWELNCTGIQTQLHGCSGTILQVRGHPEYCLTYLTHDNTWTAIMQACDNKNKNNEMLPKARQSAVLTSITDRGWNLSRVINMNQKKLSATLPFETPWDLTVNYTLTELELIPKKDLLSTTCSDLSVQHGQVLLNDMVPVFLPGEEITVRCNPGFGAKFDNGSYLKIYTVPCQMFLSLVDCHPTATELGNLVENGTSLPGTELLGNGIGPLSTGTGSLSNGIETLSNGVECLSNGVGSLSFDVWIWFVKLTVFSALAYRSVEWL
ncbi:hypothetical protein ACHWQZ_G019514 [Mnemiopsis leidyi]